MSCRNIVDYKDLEMEENPLPNSMDIQNEKIDEIVSVCSEESIAKAATSRLEEALRKFKKNDQFPTSNVSEDGQEAKILEEKKELDRRLRIGEITPFQAAQTITSGNSLISNIKKPTEMSGLLGLEQYMKRQAELSEQRKKLKSQKTGESNKEESKKMTKTGKKCLPPDKSKRVLEKHPRIVSTRTEGTEVKITDRAEIPDMQEENVQENRKRVLPPEPDNQESGSEYVPSEGEISDDECAVKKISQPRSKRRRKESDPHEAYSNSLKILDDGDESIYQERMEARQTGNLSKKSLFTVENLFKVPKSIWKRLFEYQRVSVRWLWELHGRSLGGLLGDEMGLGKTVQVIAFLAGLDVSELLSDGGRFRGLGPSLVVCPATLLQQWVKHFQDWAPLLRVCVLHHSGSYRGEPECLIQNVLKSGGILVTSYSGVLRHKEQLVESQWHYIILDEGHKIRNPEAKISRAVKRFSTPHRLLLTGSPMQNSLKELWSLFDFVLPGKLGTQATFLEHCANPITRGGYANASALQEATALQVATMLKNAIAPYMLRRTKNDVQHHIILPEKNEQVLFCSLTEIQSNLYKEYLRTEHVSSILHDKSSQSENSYRARLLVALTNLRKICNHPDLYTYGNIEEDDDDANMTEMIENFGHWKRSGKLAVVRSLLKIWKRQGHRVLLFTQGRLMMNILEALAQRENHSYLRLDGTTPMGQRQQTIHKFNNNPEYFVFISTTRVGGLGVNLTGANRVVIYDPDWNPAVDAQARERAWRIGQDKRVTIYRLINAGTVEEKIYHRQIFKLLLSNRVLEDPRQRRLFQTSDLAELFNLNEPIDGKTTESDRIFRDCKPLKPQEPNFSASKIEEMRKLASAASKKIKAMAKNAGPKVDEKIQEETAAKEDISVKKMRHKKSRKKKKELLSALFEGEEVPCLIGRRLGRSDPDEERISSTCDDEYVLSKLFSKTNVSSALQHDAVLSNARSDGSQGNSMQRMARDAAQESMDLLRQSRKWCWKPTWDAANDLE